MIAFDGISPFHLAVPQMVFGLAGVSGVKPRHDVVVCAEEPDDLAVAGGLRLRLPAGLEALASVTTSSWPPAGRRRSNRPRG